jgi:hypothetical protein
VRRLLVLPVLAVVALGLWLAVGRGNDAQRALDPPFFVPWHRVGDFALGEPEARVIRDYGRFRVVQSYGDTVEAYYRLHATKVYVSFYKSRVSALGFQTPYYRTSSGFGVGSRIPVGHGRWHGFVYNPSLRESPCSCWVKVGFGARSLRISGDNFLKPWLFIDVRHGRVTGFYVDLRYVD